LLGRRRWLRKFLEGDDGFWEEEEEVVGGERVELKKGHEKMGHPAVASV
jgi:hypothetical protein